jgi:hypothetical protein
MQRPFLAVNFFDLPKRQRRQSTGVMALQRGLALLGKIFKLETFSKQVPGRNRCGQSHPSHNGSPSIRNPIPTNASAFP